MSQIYQRNLEFLKKLNPRISEKVEKATLSGKIEAIKTKNGLPNFRLIDGDKKITFHSNINPVKQSKDFIDGENLSPTCNIAVLGLGCGYHIREILSREARRDFVVIIEKDIEVFKSFMSHFDLKELFNMRSVHLLLDEPPVEVYRFCQHFGFSMLTNSVRVVRHQPSFDAFTEYYLQAVKGIADAFSWSSINTSTQIRKAENFSDNTVENFPFRIKSPGIKAYKDAFRGRPGIIVATGPSLRKNIHLLRYAQDRAVIFALDSSLKILMEEGIEPDFVFSIDFTENTINDYQGIDSFARAYVVVDPEVCPSVVRKYPDRLIFIDLPEKPLCDWFASITEDKGRIDKGLSVCHTAFLAAIYMGLSPVILIGQDLSYPSGETHARGTSLSTTMKNMPADDGKKLYVTNIFGAPVLTDKAMMVFLHHYRDIISENSPLRCINATEGGALIEGTEVRTLKDALLAFCGEKSDVQRAIREKHESARRNISLDEARMMESIRKVSEVLGDFHEQITHHQALLAELHKSMRQDDLSLVGKGLEDLKGHSAFLNDFKKEIALLRDNITEGLVLQTKKIIFDEKRVSADDKKSIAEIIGRDKIFFENLEQASRNMRERLEKLAKDLEGYFAQKK
jgi:hypothetical protein